MSAKNCATCPNWGEGDRGHLGNARKKTFFVGRWPIIQDICHFLTVFPDLGHQWAGCGNRSNQPVSPRKMSSRAFGCEHLGGLVYYCTGWCCVAWSGMVWSCTLIMVWDSREVYLSILCLTCNTGYACISEALRHGLLCWRLSDL